MSMDFNELLRWLSRLVTDDFFAALESLAIAVAVGLAIHFVLFRLFRRFVRHSRVQVGPEFFTRLAKASRILFPTIAVQRTSEALSVLGPEIKKLVMHVLALVAIAATARIIVVLISGVEEHLQQRHPVNVPNNYNARRVRTQAAVLKRVMVLFVVTVAISLALMTFPHIRQLGASLLASAGIAGLVVGLAAKPVVEALLGGMQIAITRPIEIEDVVIVDNEWGWIEEIAAMYVVVRTWDLRRLIVPFSKFLQEPFQNWTRRSTDLMGTVMIYVDYAAPIQPIREALDRIVRASDKWDGRVCVLQVTDATDRTIELRALVSASDSSILWDLRALVREKLIEFLQREYPECLPRQRVEMPSLDGRPLDGRPLADRAPSEDRTDFQEVAGNRKPR